MGYYVYTTLNFRPGGYDKWTEASAPLHEYVLNDELSTQAALSSVPLEHRSSPSSTPSILTFEGYPDADALYKAHFASEAMRTYVQHPDIPTMLLGSYDVDHYEDVGGFLARSSPEDRTIPGGDAGGMVWYDTRIWCTSGKRDQIVAGLKSLAEAVEKNEALEGVKSFLLLKSLDEPELVRIFERYVDDQAYWKMRGSQVMIKTFDALRDAMRTMEQRAFVALKEGFLGR